MFPFANAPSNPVKLFIPSLAQQKKTPRLNVEKRRKKC